MRAGGRRDVFFDLHLNDRVGTPSAPPIPSTIAAKAQKEFDFAQQVTGCATPMIAENELFGAQTPTPWSATNAQYRANVLALLQELDALGATTAITIANPPYTGGDAADWWRAGRAGRDPDPPGLLHLAGAEGLYDDGARARRAARCGSGMRGLVAHFAQIGIPAARVALELQFQSAPGQGGRNGLQPKAAWLEIVKLEALAAKQVAAETKIQGVWSWGWPSFSVAGADPDKPAAACVYLWARDPTFCDGPRSRAPASTPRSPRARSSCPRRPLHARQPDDPEDRREPRRRDHRRPRLGCERAARARGAARRRAGRPGDDARRGARDRA